MGATNSPITGPAQRKRIAILGTRGIPARYGGFETFAQQLALRLTRRGYEVTVYAEAEGAPAADSNFEGIRVRQRRRPHWGPASVLAYDAACLWDARRGYDLVYMLGYGAAWACWWPRWYDTPVWINVDGLEWRRGKWGAAARLYLRAMEWLAPRMATRVIADAQTIAARFQRLYPHGAPCSFIAYGAEPVTASDADPARLTPWGLQSQHYHLVVARLEPENHIAEIISGHQQRTNAWPLVVVGDLQPANAYRERLRAEASVNVHFTGGIYDCATLNALRWHAASYVHGHSVGGTNPSLLEALACGNWIVAHDNPFNREVARDAADYFTNPTTLASALAQREQADSAEIATRHARARHIAATYYTWERIVDAYDALIQSELAR